MNVHCKAGRDYLARECIDCLYRANNAHRASSWLDDLGLHMARTHWRAGAMYASLGNQHWEPAQRKTGKPVVIIPAVELTPSTATRPTPWSVAATPSSGSRTSLPW